MVEIKKGEALDRAIAKVIGLRLPDDRFWPSTDLTDAFSAAEAVGLFDEINRVLRKDILDKTWEIVDVLASSEVILASEDTPALAICAAILKIKSS